jgi:prenyl protein peptidase
MPRPIEPDLPALSTISAIALLLIYTLAYVIPFYLSSKTRPSPTLSRDAPSVIRARIRSVSLSCTLCTLTTFFLLLYLPSNGTALAAIHLMGYYPPGILDTVKCLALTAILFVGPLFEAGIVEGGWRNWIRLRGVDVVIGSWMGWRNFVAVCLFSSLLLPFFFSTSL